MARPENGKSRIRLMIPEFHSCGRKKIYYGNPSISRSEEHTSELQSLMRISYAVFGFKLTNEHSACGDLDLVPAVPRGILARSSDLIRTRINSQHILDPT